MIRQYPYVWMGCLWIFATLWLGLNLLQPYSFSGLTLCPIHLASGYPCPSCGATRSLIFILQGNFSLAWSMNPLGFFLGLGWFVFPVWVGHDLWQNRPTMKDYWEQFEALLNQRRYAILFAVCMIILWIRNIIFIG